MNPQCEKFRDNFEDYLLGNLAPEEKKSLETHLSLCRDCVREFEKEKRFTALFQSLERKPAPEVLKRRVLDFAHSRKEAKAGWMERLSGILTLPRLRILSGAAALAILVFWGAQFIRSPRPLEKPPVKASRDMRYTGEEIKTRDTEYPDIINRLDEFGASQISHLEKDKESAPNRYAFAISSDKFERFANEAQGAGVRIVNVTPLTVSDSFLETGRGIQIQESVTEELEPLSLERQKSLSHYPSASQSPAPKTAARMTTLSKEERMEAEYKYLPKEASSLSVAAPTRTPPASILADGWATMVDEISSPTIIKSREGGSLRRLADEETLLYVEIEIEPDQ